MSTALHQGKKSGTLLRRDEVIYTRKRTRIKLRYSDIAQQGTQAQDLLDSLRLVKIL